MKTDRPHLSANPVLPRGVRWTAIAAGIVTAVIFFASGWLGLLLPSTLIIGAIVQPYVHRPGKWLLIAGAFSLTVMSASALAERSMRLRELFPLQFDNIVFPLLALILFILIIWCDVGLIVYALKSRSHSKSLGRENFHPLNWLVWLTAAGASAVFVPEGVRDCILLHRHVIGVDFSVLPLFVLPGLALAVLDVALLTQGIKALHTYLSDRYTTAV